MDFLRRNFEAAQAQAKLAAASAGKLAEQLGDHTKTLTEQAGHLTKTTAEQAQQRLKELHIAEQLDKLAASSHQQQEEAPSLSELRLYGITSDFKDFVRSLTYSTFRDFPVEELELRKPAPAEREMPYLTPWQEHHAMLVVRAVREINELRFVLCPKRMTDEQFWKIYFILCKRYLPDTAFDPSFQPGSSTGPQEKIVVGPFGTLDIHSKLQQWQQAAQHFGQQTAAQLKTAAATRGFGGAATASQSGSPVSVSLHELAERGLHPGFATGNGDEGELHHAGLSADPDLEAYLREVESRHAGNGHKDANDKASSHDGSDASIIDGDVDGEEGRKQQNDVAKAPTDETEGGNDDFDKYISELHHDGSASEAEEQSADEGSGEELDLDDYLKDLQEEEKP